MPPTEYKQKLNNNKLHDYREFDKIPPIEYENSIRGIKRLKSQAIFKSIEKLSDSRILDIYLRVLKKKNERQEHWKPPPACP